MLRLLAALFALTLATTSCRSTAVEDSPAEAVIHSVYFELGDDSEAATGELMRACHEYLAGLPGVRSLRTATRIQDLTGPVNDQAYDVALHVVFVDRAALDDYAEAPRHLEFIEVFSPNWTSVRVFDSETGQ